MYYMCTLINSNPQIRPPSQRYIRVYTIGVRPYVNGYYVNQVGLENLEFFFYLSLQKKKIETTALSAGEKRARGITKLLSGRPGARARVTPVARRNHTLAGICPLSRPSRNNNKICNLARHYNGRHKQTQQLIGSVNTTATTILQDLLNTIIEFITDCIITYYIFFFRKSYRVNNKYTIRHSI